MQTEIKNPWEVDAPKKEPRKRGNPNWKKGVSGNPKGRPPGIVDRRLKWREALEGNVEDVLSVVIEAALEKDVQAASLVLSRVIPPLRARDGLVEFELDTKTPLAEQVEQVLKAMSEGNVSPDTAKQIIETIGALGSIRQIDELEQRLAALEGR